MTRIWQCGFEMNSTAVGMEVSTTSGTLAMQAITVRTGGFALRVNPTAGTAFVRYHAFATDQAIVGYQRVYINIASLPTVTTTIMRFVDVLNNNVAAIRLTTAGKLQLLTAAGTQIGSDSATAITTGTWARIELKNDASGAGALDGRLNGTSFASGANSAQGSWSRILIGVIATSATADLYYDDWCINDGSGSQQASWPGDGHIMHLVPNGDGDSHTWGNNANAAGASTNYTLVSDNAPPNDTTNVVQSVTLNAEDMYALTDSGLGAGDAVNCVMVGARYKNNTADATTAFRLQVKKTSGGTIAQSASIIPNSTSFMTNANVEPRNYPIVTFADPDGAAWTQSTLDSMQAGVKLTAAGVNRIQVTSVWASVDYTPAATTPVSSPDTGSGAEATSALTAATSSADTGAGADAGSVAVATSATETGSGADTVSALAVSVSSADTATAADAPILAAATVASDTATAADDASVTAAVAGADTGSATEASALTVAVSDADTVTAVEGSPVVGVTDDDAATATDTHALTATVTGSDTAASTDTTAVGLTSSDTATGTDTASALQVSITGTDSGTWSEVAAVDTGSGLRNVADGDAWSAVDSEALTVHVSDADNGTCTDAATLTVTVFGSDGASAVDAAGLTAALLVADIASGADTAVTLTASLAGLDVATASETALLLAALVAADTGTAQEAEHKDASTGPAITYMTGSATVRRYSGTATVRTYTGRRR